MRTILCMHQKNKYIPFLIIIVKIDNFSWGYNRIFTLWEKLKENII